MNDGYYWAFYPASEPEIVRVIGAHVEGFWNCEMTLAELQREGVRFVGPLTPPEAP